MMAYIGQTSYDDSGYSERKYYLSPIASDKQELGGVIPKPIDRELKLMMRFGGSTIELCRIIFEPIGGLSKIIFYHRGLPVLKGIVMGGKPARLVKRSNKVDIQIIQEL